MSKRIFRRMLRELENLRIDVDAECRYFDPYEIRRAAYQRANEMLDDCERVIEHCAEECCEKHWENDGRHTVFVVWHMNDGKSPQFRVLGNRKALQRAVMPLVGKYDGVGWEAVNIEGEFEEDFLAEERGETGGIKGL